jgi:hypothetical protein
MIEIKVDTAPMLARVDNMLADVEGFYGEIFIDFVAWQEQDMKRTFPSITPDPPDSVHTMIYPRSRALKWRRRGKRLRKGSRIVRPKPQRGAQRPILRPELFDRLQDRMGQLLIDKVKWR